VAKRIHVCNAFFEQEVSGQIHSDLKTAFSDHPIFALLQLLPLLYAAPDEGVVVNAKPEAEFFQQSKLPMPRSLYFLDEPLPSGSVIVDWGASRLIKKWAEEQGASYDLPKWEVVEKLSSKLFSFEKSPLPGARRLFHPDEIEKLAREIQGPFVIKDCLENAGRGHFFLKPGQPLNRQALSAFVARGHPLIAEPWVQRVIDFSTQWEITPAKEIRYLGLTICHSDSFGKYLASEVGNPSFSFDPKIYEELLEEIAELGFFGNLGIDAMIYKTKQGEALQKIVEINPRKTMGYVALEMQKRHFLGKHLTLSFSDLKERSLLAKTLVTREGKRLKLRKTVLLGEGEYLPWKRKS